MNLREIWLGDKFMQELELIQTGISNLDLILNGGIPINSLNMIAGNPGSGKTIFVQQIMFNFIKSNPDSCVLYITTLSEPMMKVIRYLQHFTFFSGESFGERVIYKDAGELVGKNSLREIQEFIKEQVAELQPKIFVIDSFKAIRDLSENEGKFRQFCNELSIQLSSARCTTFLVGEYSRAETTTSTEFTVSDGIIFLGISKKEGEQCRYIQILKLRGMSSRMEEFPFIVNDNGINILSPSLTLQHHVWDFDKKEKIISSGIKGLDTLISGGFGRGRALILSGVSGTGKTTLALQFLHYGVTQGQKGMLISFEETREGINKIASGFGWDFEELEQKGMLKIMYIAQPDIQLEKNLAEIVREVWSFRPVRFVMDSFSVFLHRVKDSTVQRDKAFHLANLIQKSNAVGMLISDIATGSRNKFSRFGVEETVMDGTIVLSSELDGYKRKRYIEVYKLRAARHVTGQHRMEITSRGIEVFYFKLPEINQIKKPKSLEFTPTKHIFKSNPAYGSAWLIRGDPGIGKSTLAYQFAFENLRRKDAVLFITIDVPHTSVRENMQNYGFLVDPYLETKQFVILDLSGYAQEYPSDPEKFLQEVKIQTQRMPKPVRVIIDSLSPIALDYSPNEFIKLIYQKNKLLQQPNICIFDTILNETLTRSETNRLVNAYEIFIDLFTPDWGEMTQAGKTGLKSLQVRKSRGIASDIRPFPYTIGKAGIVVQKNFYTMEGY